jgi:hypothetical protein
MLGWPRGGHRHAGGVDRGLVMAALRAIGFDVAMAALTLAIGRMLCSGVDRRFAWRLLVGALALHWFLVCSLQLVLAARGHSPFLVPDEHAYDLVARQLSRFWLGTGPAVPQVNDFLEGPFATLVAGAYTAGGHTPLVGLAIPVAFGTWFPVLVHRLMSEHLGAVGRRAARTGALLALLYPASIGWSCLLLKDSSVTFASTAVVLAVLALPSVTRSPRERLVDLALGLAGIAWLIETRGAQLVPIAIGIAVIAIAWVLRQPIRKRIAIFGVIVCGLAAIVSVSQVRHELGQVPVRLAVHREASRVGARTAEAPEGPPSQATWLSTVGHVPAGLALALVRPYPTEVQNASQALGAAGNLIYLVFCAIAAAGIAAAVRAGLRTETLLLVATVAASWIVLSVAEGNAGTAWRHRDAVTPLLACFAGVTVARSTGAKAVADAISLRLSPRRTRPMQTT